MNIFHIKYDGETCIYFVDEAILENGNSDVYVEYKSFKQW